jgi:hypothetical protein
MLILKAAAVGLCVSATFLFARHQNRQLAIFWGVLAVMNMASVLVELQN